MAVFSVWRTIRGAAGRRRPGTATSGGAYSGVDTNGDSDETSSSSGSCSSNSGGGSVRRHKHQSRRRKRKQKRRSNSRRSRTDGTRKPYYYLSTRSRSNGAIARRTWIGKVKQKLDFQHELSAGAAARVVRGRNYKTGHVVNAPCRCSDTCGGVAAAAATTTATAAVGGGGASIAITNSQSVHPANRSGAASPSPPPLSPKPTTYTHTHTHAHAHARTHAHGCITAGGCAP